MIYKFGNGNTEATTCHVPKTRHNNLQLMATFYCLFVCPSWNQIMQKVKIVHYSHSARNSQYHFEVCLLCQKKPFHHAGRFAVAKCDVLSYYKLHGKATKSTYHTHGKYTSIANGYRYSQAFMQLAT